MSWQAYVRFGVWMALSIAVYCLYSVHSTDGRYAALETHPERYKTLRLGSDSEEGPRMHVDSLAVVTSKMLLLSILADGMVAHSACPDRPF